MPGYTTVADFLAVGSRDMVDTLGQLWADYKQVAIPQFTPGASITAQQLTEGVFNWWNNTTMDVMRGIFQTDTLRSVIGKIIDFIT